MIDIPGAHDAIVRCSMCVFTSAVLLYIAFQSYNHNNSVSKKINKQVHKKLGISTIVGTTVYSRFKKNTETSWSSTRY